MDADHEETPVLKKRGKEAEGGRKGKVSAVLGSRCSGGCEGFLQQEDCQHKVSKSDNPLTPSKLGVYQFAIRYYDTLKLLHF